MEIHTSSNSPAIIIDKSISRSQLLNRLIMSSDKAVSDAELLEVLLTPTTAKPHEMAIRLLERFTTLAKVIYAEEHEIKGVKHVCDSVVQMLCCVRALGERVLHNEIAERSLIDRWSKLMEYCTLTMAHEKVETFRVLFMNHAHVLIADEVMHRGTVNHTPVYPREVVKRALELSAGAIILVHNHPSGDAIPSQADIDMTYKIAAAADTMGIKVHDHIIISEKGHYSFVAAALIGTQKASPHQGNAENNEI